MTYAIGNFGFVRWEGPPPQLVRQHIQRFTKTGQGGISALALGVHGDPFTVNLTAAYPNQGSGMLAEDGYRWLVGANPQVVLFNSINYLTVFQHTYLVDSVSTTSSKRIPLTMGIGYAYPGGWLLKSTWQLVPIT